MIKSSTEMSYETVLVNKEFPILSRWQHKKGGIYMPVCSEIDTDTGEFRIAYRRVGGPSYDVSVDRYITFSRPIQEWRETERFKRIA